MSPGGWVAPGLRIAPGIPAWGGGGGRPQAEPTKLPPTPPRPAMPGRDRGGGGGAREEGGGGRLAEEVLIVLVDVELQAQVGATGLGLWTLDLPRQVPRGPRLHEE